MTKTWFGLDKIAILYGGISVTAIELVIGVIAFFAAGIPYFVMYVNGKKPDLWFPLYCLWLLSLVLFVSR